MHLSTRNSVKLHQHPSLLWHCQFSDNKGIHLIKIPLQPWTKAPMWGQGLSAFSGKSVLASCDYNFPPPPNLRDIMKLLTSSFSSSCHYTKAGQLEHPTEASVVRQYQYFHKLPCPSRTLCWIQTIAWHSSCMRVSRSLSATFKPHRSDFTHIDLTVYQSQMHNVI